MKKILILILILQSTFLFSEDVLRPKGEISSAYNDYYHWSPPVYVGIEAGVLYNSFKFNQSSNLPLPAPDNYSKGNGYSPYLSAVIDYRMNGFWGFQTLIGFQQIAYSNNSNTFDYLLKNLDPTYRVTYQSDWKKTVSYANIQFSARYDITRKIILNLGAFLNYKVSESTFQNKTNYKMEFDSLFYLKEIPKAFDAEISEKMIYGITAGLAYRFFITNDLYLNFQGRYQFSFKNALKDIKLFPRYEKIYQYLEYSGRQNQLFSAGISLIYKY